MAEKNIFYLLGYHLYNLDNLNKQDRLIHLKKLLFLCKSGWRDRQLFLDDFEKTLKDSKQRVPLETFAQLHEFAGECLMFKTWMTQAELIINQGN